MKNILFILFTFSGISLFGQVGIGTTDPQTTLDVNGDMTIRDKIYTGGSDTELGNPGTPGQVLISAGDGEPPMWKSLNVPRINPGDFYLIYTNAFFDETGLSFSSGEATGVQLYTRGTDISAMTGWKTIEGLTQPFEVYSETNKIYITYEAVVQLSGSGADTGVDFACGVFVDNKLQGVRVATAKRSGAANHAFATFLMVNIADQLTEGEHQVKVACARVQNLNYTGDFSVGQSLESNINNFVAKSSLKVEVYEVPDTFVDITE